MNTTGYVLIGIVIIAAAIVVWLVSTSNEFRTMLVRIKEADSGIDVALTKRYDTLTKMMDVVRAYAKHEVDTIQKTIELRQGMSVAEKADCSRKLDGASESLRVIAEAYPELRSSENYRVLEDAILDAEDHLQAARRVYNMNVSAFNQLRVRFPASLIASAAHYGAQPFFEADAIKRDDVKINLDINK